MSAIISEIKKKTLYKLQYKWGDGYETGVGWINLKHCNGTQVDILCDSGGVRYTEIKNVIFMKEIGK